MTFNRTFLNRSMVDRRSPLDRRTIDLGPKFPNPDRRKGKCRRKGMEKRTDWKPVNRWSSSPNQFRSLQPYEAPVIDYLDCIRGK